jgi:hypothetical protein
LASSGAPALQVAEQLGRAARPGDVEAVTWMVNAAREAAPTSPDIAVELLGRAVAIMDSADPGRDALFAERGTT